MNEIKEFLEQLEKSNKFSKSKEIILNFIKKNKELQVSEIKKLLKITVDNYQVFGIFNSWNNSDNKTCQDFYSKYVDVLIEERQSLDEDALKRLYKVFNAIYLSYLRADNDRKDIFLYHGNSVITSLSFIKNKKLFSRKYGDENAIMQTYQNSDEKDKKQDIYNDIFFDNSDIGKNNICAYGPIIFVFDAEKILHLDIEIKVTKDNPFNIKENEDMYFSNLQEIKKEMQEGKHKFHRQFKHHSTIKNFAYLDITEENLKYIIIENHKNVDEVFQLNQDGKIYSSIELKKILDNALKKANLSDVEVKVRDEKNDKYCPKMSTDVEELWSTNLEVLYK